MTATASRSPRPVVETLEQYASTLEFASQLRLALRHEVGEGQFGDQHRSLLFVVLLP